MCFGEVGPKPPRRPSAPRWVEDVLMVARCPCGHQDLLNRPPRFLRTRRDRPTLASLKDQRSLAIDRIVKDASTPGGPDARGRRDSPREVDHSGHLRDTSLM